LTAGRFRRSSIRLPWQVEQAKGQLAQAKAQQSLARINLKRDTPLVEARAIAQSQPDNEKQQAEQADPKTASLNQDGGENR
jgi:membrane fusion protein (multidrug efflux system)